ncbi:trigger factor [Conchiformibius kuhniae]|uniref:Trigger factor n=1 Tax=Conchiformibius kuhniae TaxID=211502 RepID=A0ABD8B859_9NEIS|nr:trigger factor [Conchiformibius kuhniae]
MSATVEQLDNLERRLVVSVAWSDINAETDKRLKATARRVRIDGFRPGKAPLKMVASMYGADIQNEVLNKLAQQAFQEAVAEHGLNVAALLRVDGVEDQAEDAADFQAAFVFEVFPEVNIGDLSALEVEKAVTEVGDAEVEKTIEILRKQRTRFNRVERAAQDGDRVIIDFEGKIDGEPFEGGTAQNYPFVLGQGQMLPEFEAGVSGLKEGESKEISLTFPEDYHGKDVAGKTAVFTISLSNVAEPELPEINEDFAKALGIENGDLTKMREEILKNVSREAKRRIAGKNTETVLAALHKHVPLTLPRALVDEEAQRLAEEMRENFVRQGLDAANLNLPADMFAERAQANVALGLILPVLVKEHKLQPDDAQIKAIVSEFAESYEDPQEVVDWYFADRERLKEPTNMALEANVVDFVFGLAKVTERSVSFDELMSAN